MAMNILGAKLRIRKYAVAYSTLKIKPKKLRV